MVMGAPHDSFQLESQAVVVKTFSFGLEGS